MLEVWAEAKVAAVAAAAWEVAALVGGREV